MFVGEEVLAFLLRLAACGSWRECLHQRSAYEIVEVNGRLLVVVVSFETE